MERKHKLEKIFNDDYPGTERFIADVIKPIFGNEIEYKDDDLAEREEYAEKAKNAGIKHIRYIGNLTEKNYSAENIALLDVTLDDSKNIERSRVNIQRLIRSIMDYRQHLMIVFHYEDVANKQWRFSYAYKGDSLKDTTSAKRYTYVFGRGYRGRTAAERFDILARSQRNDDDFEKAFSVAALSDEFFDKYRNIYADFVELITGKRYEKEKGTYVEKFKHDPDPQFAATFDNQDKTVRDYVKKMFGRIVFLYFLQRKGWLYDNDGKSNPTYMHDLFANSTCKDNFLDGCLETLFFRVLNTDKPNRDANALSLPGGLYIPYLNGGLFQEDDIDRLNCVFPTEYFQKLFDFLDSYNFTIDENDREDAEIGIDPEMLGRIFENLLEDNKDKGAFYTPKEIVDYMCRESIIAYLQDDKFSQEGNERIREFIETQNIELLNERQRDYIEDRLIKVKICDPAIGSGAFPMGLVNLLSKLFIALRTYKTIDQAKMKRYIMQNSIYGVDIEKGAVDIARLRFWLAMVVDEVEPQPLPNLNFKIMQGNSLLEYFNGLDLSTLMKRESGRIDFITDTEREQLRRDLNRYYNESNHEVRDKIMQSIKNTVVRMILNADPDSPLSGVDVSETDKFFLWHTWFVDVFEKGGFDIVIGNPPYIKEGRGDHGIFESVKDSPYYLGKMDIWYMFAGRGIDMLKPGGNLCFIATNNWTTSAGAKKLRNKIINETQIVQLCDFRDYMIFDSASIQTMVMQFKKNHTIDDYTFDLRVLLGDTLADVSMMLTKDAKANAHYLRPNIVRNEYRNQFLTFSAHGSLFSKLKNSRDCIFLNDNEVTQGIVPNPDCVNSRNIKKLTTDIVSQYDIVPGCPVFVVPTNFFESLTATEQKLLKPLYEPIDLTKYSIRTHSKEIIYLTRNNSDDETLFPNFISHLSKFRPIMEERRETMQGRIAYYQLHWSREESKFVQGEKILVPRKCSEPTFTFTSNAAYVMMSINVIISSRVDMKYLTALLNSKLVEFWLRNKGKMQGLNFQLDKEPLQQIPIKLASDNAQRQLSDILNNIIAAIAQQPDADITAYENQIDHIVYHLYELTYDEVLIIDPETPITREEYENFSLE